MDLLRARGFHLLSHDGLDLREHLEAKREPTVDAGRGAADVSRTDEKAVRGDLGVGGVFTERAKEERGHPEHGASLAGGARPLR